MAEREPLKLSDLYVPCERCGGSGHLNERAPSGAGFGRSMIARSGPCDDCDGRGGKLTPDGQVIVDFLNRIRGRGFGY